MSKTITHKREFDNIYSGKTVLVTGHTGFKGSWLSMWLNELGANVVGFSLRRYYNMHLFNKSGLANRIHDERGDICSINRLREVISKYSPEIVFHLAAQPLVRLAYKEPVMTFHTNVIGTVNILECIREFNSIKAGVIVTSDKCYKNKEIDIDYNEDDELGGFDPYSASKACAEMVISSYNNSFFRHTGKIVSSARAGNVIGGGDYSPDRIMTDCILALKANEPIKIRNPLATRPWQHVLEPLHGYLLLGEKLLKGKNEFVGAWNFGPDKKCVAQVCEVVDEVIRVYGYGKWINVNKADEKLHEARLLSLDNSKAKKKLGWHPIWNLKTAIKYTVDWYKKSQTKDIYSLCIRQIEDYQKNVRT